MLPNHQLEQNPDILTLRNQRGVWRNFEYLVKDLLIEQIELFYKQINWVEKIELFFKQTKKEKTV